jgi:alkylation response protein AidB-like acyl-CoA dehydrogenase
MDFHYSDEQKMLMETVRRMTMEKIAPRAAEMDEKGEYPQDVFEMFASAGFMGLALPEKYGGSDMGTLGLALAVIETAKFCSNSALLLLLSKLPTSPILYGGNEEQKQHYITGVATGKMRGAFGLTEPGAGSDSANIRTTARKDGNYYVLNGTKHWISGGTVADFYTVSAKTDLKAGSKGFSIFIIDRNTPGFRVGASNKKLGMKGIPTCELIMEDCRVPAEMMVGEENEGFKTVMKTLNSVRPLVAARGVGLAMGVTQYAADYAKERETFGKPIIEHQAIQFMLAELAIKIEASYLLTMQAAKLVDEGKFGKAFAPYLSMAKAFATETAVQASGDAIQILGSYGYSAEYPLERFYRDAKQLTIVEGTSQVQRMIIGKAMTENDIRYY